MAMPIADPRNRSDFRDKTKQCCIAIQGCDGKVASDLRVQAAISEPKTPSFCGISGDLTLSTRKSLAIAIVRFWCAKYGRDVLVPTPSVRQPLFETSDVGSVGCGGVLLHLGVPPCCPLFPSFAESLGQILWIPFLPVFRVWALLLGSLAMRKTLARSTTCFGFFTCAKWWAFLSKNTW